MRTLLFISALCLSSVAMSAPPSLKSWFEQSSNGVDGVAVDRRELKAPVALKRFYFERGYQSAGWASARAELLQAVETASDHGLDANNYHLERLKQLNQVKSWSASDKLSWELLATDAWLSLAANILGGQLDPIAMEPDWTAARRERDLVKHLQGAIEQGRLVEALTELQPDAPAYTQLKKSLSELRQRPALIDVAPVPAGGLLKPGMTSDRIPALRTKMHSKGYQLSTLESQHYDAELSAQVTAWQANNGLKSDGIVGEATLRLLNQNDKDRLRMLQVNMERWRWLPENLGERHIRVNIADFKLEARNRGVVEREHAVIVGRQYRETPIFSNTIRYVIINPWWETPASIARKDKLPDFQKNPALVNKMGYEVFDTDGNRLNPDNINWHAYRSSFLPLRLRQKPGPNNALGQVKIMFPNPHSVYLHDTPTKDLFAKTQRDFSSGCVRVQHAMDLTYWLLAANTESDRQKAKDVLASGVETRINLSQPVPVHVLYFTAITGKGGGVQYLHDIYNRDQRIAKALGL